MVNYMKRILKHQSYPRWWVHRLFPKAILRAIEAEVKKSEANHDSELRFVVEGGLDLPQLLHRLSARQRAVELFSQLRVWDTEHNSGVLIYVQLADRKVEILADRGIHKKAGDKTWQTICAGMERAFAAGNFQEGAVEGIRTISRELTEHFPAHRKNPNELPDAPLVL